MGCGSVDLEETKVGGDSLNFVVLTEKSQTMFHNLVAL